MEKKSYCLRALLGLFVLLASSSATAQVYAQLKLWDSHLRYPQINEIEFCGADSSLATYDAIYGHGAMWENEYIGYRIYMDHRQSIDLYGKQYPQMELATTNFYSNADLMQQGYGEDILFVGASVGAGSFRGYVDGETTYIDSVSARGQRIVKNGPDTVVVEVWDKDWKYKGQTLQMKQTYTALRGHRDILIDIELQGCSDKEVFATGVQKLESDNQGFVTKRGLAVSWGSNVPDKAHPELVETLGLGVIVEPKYLASVKEDANNYLCLVHPVKGHIRYRLFAASKLQREGGFDTAKNWFNWMKKQ